ncbi:hypothetical protein C1I64_06585 [Rathayibacter festucae DSM 15932]|uniref:MarR family transcriptional regulator n=1 Tax=Rathayibacter festucae DSM 15932 TaxID=1328866 RepID=A0A3Q9UXW4_9MICO|nr:hypothetical protein C1I64_06585 [Rathayibacter festucae DSM 15932]
MAAFRPDAVPSTCRSCAAGRSLDALILIELARGVNCDESRLLSALAVRVDHRIGLVQLRSRLRELANRGLVLLEGHRRTMLLRIAQFSITRAGRDSLAAHARALDLLAEEIHVALLTRR